MIRGRRVLAVIPARGGSKGVPRKNVREVGGRPLIAWTIAAARRSHYIDRLVLSSEDPEIMAVAAKWGCEVPFRRPEELARDDSPGIDPVLHAIDQLPGFDLVVLLQPTSPLRLPEDIDGCLEKMLEGGAPACVSVTLAEQSPYWMYEVGMDGALRPLLPDAGRAVRRQDVPPVYVLNGAVYVADCAWLRQNRTFLTEGMLGYAMPAERSLDIDTEFDLKILDLRIQEVGHGNHQETG